MEPLIHLVALLRPLASIEQAAPIFEAAGVGLFAILLAALLIDGSVRKSLRLSAIDGVIVAFTCWCLAVSAIYYDSVRVGEVAKLLVPLLSFTIVKNIISDKAQFNRLFVWTLIGLAVPTAASAVLIAANSPSAVDMVNYWTQVTRWKGVYTHSHVLAHSMTLTLMTIAIYVTLRGRLIGQERSMAGVERTLLALLAVIALYCLYMSQVRSAILGLAVFAGVYFFFLNRKALIIGAAAIAILAISTVTYWYAALLPEMVTAERGIDVKATDFGSGRPNFWLHDLRVFAELPLDRKLAGVGIGARGEHSITSEAIIGHSDWLELLTQTGVIGVLLFAALQVLILRRILRLADPERYAFLGLFLAVNAMMLISNSYAWRIQVSQLYYMLLAFIEIPAVQAAREPPMQIGRSVAHGAVSR